MFLNLKILVFPDLEGEIILNYKDLIKDSDHDSDERSECIAYAKYKVRYTEACIEYQKSIPEEVASFTADMQRVTVLPKLTTKEHLFLSRLVTFTGTFASKTHGRPDYCILCHEAIACRKAPDVASAFLQLNRHVMKITSGYGQTTAAVRTKTGIYSLVWHNV